MSVPLRNSRLAVGDPNRRIRLVLKTPEGGPWPLILSQGMERFVGHYPRVPGLGSGGPLLRFERIRATG